MGKSAKSKKIKTSTNQANREQYNLPIEDRSVASIEIGEPEGQIELKFKNLRWSKVI